MNVDKAVDKACKQKELIDALTEIAIWECDRAVKQALRTQGLYETCFEVCFSNLLARWNVCK